MRTYVAFIVLPMVGALACGGPTVGPEDFVLPPGARPPVVTDAAVYTLEHRDREYVAEALATYTNSTGRPVYYQRCMPDFTGPINCVRRTGEDSTARVFVGGAWACVGGVPTGRVLPGESISARVSLGSTDSPQARPRVTPEERVGRFRIEFALCARQEEDSDNCELLPQAARESNAFDVRFAGP
jgi:hypothetical protein